jgi:DNA-binding NtrC family response regulator/pSer/pThr/pTyr-binding forkhead associated (FHA) protein
MGSDSLLGKTNITTTSRKDQHVEGRLSVLVIGEGIEAQIPLPDEGDAVIGRSNDCDVRIPHQSVSRNHAVIHVGAPLTIEDLSSSNGTRVRGTKLLPNTPTPFAPGEPIEIGNVLVVVQRRMSPRPRHIWTHADFEKRLDEECARARRAEGRFVVIRMKSPPNNDGVLVREALGKILREMDILGAYGPDDHEMLLPETTASIGRGTEQRIVEELRAKGVAVRTGIACFPEDGRDPWALLGHAAELASAEEEKDRTMQAQAVLSPLDALHRLVDRIATGTINVLITGETGAGKEVLAARIHKQSRRAEKQFVSLHCAALSETLLESELFGHERGAFTGAVQTKQGLLELAHGGTVFLDEVGELPLSMQVKLLRVLEDRLVLRVGSLKPRPIDVRFVAATNRDLEAEVARGTFRQDLYFRLNGITLVVPPLRERRSEILPLANAFMAEAAQRNSTPAPRLADDVKMLLASYPWPGNVRELRNVIERAVLLTTDGVIRPAHLPPAMSVPEPAAAPAPSSPPSSPSNIAIPVAHAALAQPAASSAPVPQGGGSTLDDEPSATGRSRVDPKRIAEVLLECGGNQTDAAKILGVSRRTVINWVEKYGLPRPRKR